MRIWPTTVATAAISLTLLAGIHPASASGRIPLRDTIVAHEHVVTLSDLLPVNASGSIRVSAKQIELGEAPLPGERRALKREFVFQALNASPSLRNLFEIPDEIEVTRWSRLLTRDDVFQAIRESLLSNSFSGAGSLTLKDVIFTPSVTVTEQTPSLKVTRIAPTPDGAGMRIRLWTISEPRVPPFWVRLSCEIDLNRTGSSVNGGLRHAARDAETRTARPPDSIRNAWTNTLRSDAEEHKSRRALQTIVNPVVGASDPLLVARSGETIQLVLQGRDLRITTTAVPLDMGRKGQKVRVRAVLTGKILVATVVGADKAEVDY